MVHTRATNLLPLLFDPEIERHLSRLRRRARETDQGAATMNDDVGSQHEGDMTLRQLTEPNYQQQPLAVQFPELPDGVSFELKSGLIHLLPQFHGMSGEDPNKHLAEFHAVCSSMKPRNITEEQIKLRAFPFSLKDAARDWFYYLPQGGVETWER